MARDHSGETLTLTCAWVWAHASASATSFLPSAASLSFSVTAASQRVLVDGLEQQSEEEQRGGGAAASLPLRLKGQRRLETLVSCSLSVRASRVAASNTWGTCIYPACMPRLLYRTVTQHRVAAHPHVRRDALPLARRVVGPEWRQVQHVTRPQRRAHRGRARRAAVGGVGGGGAGGGLGGGVRHAREVRERVGARVHVEPRL
eukprot:scaffold72584_cov75-Phaeocystis_antarctica.AAC.3